MCRKQDEGLFHVPLFCSCSFQQDCFLLLIFHKFAQRKHCSVLSCTSRSILCVCDGRGGGDTPVSPLKKKKTELPAESIMRPTARGM